MSLLFYPRSSLTQLLAAAFLCSLAAPAEAQPKPKDKRIAKAPGGLQVDKPCPRLGLHSATDGADLNLADPLGHKTLVIFFNTGSDACRRKVIEIDQAARPFVKDKRLSIIGVIEEPRAGRARLFAEWKKLDWTLLHDPLNLAEATDLPLVIALDENAVVRAMNPKLDALEKDFVTRRFKKPRRTPEVGDVLPDPRVTRRIAREARTAAKWRAHGDALILAGAPAQIDEAVKAYQDSLRAHDAKNDPYASYRLGTAAMLRLTSERRRPGDFALALNSWYAAYQGEPAHDSFRSALLRFAPGRTGPRPPWVESAASQIPDRAKQLLVADAAPWTPDLSSAQVESDSSKGKPPNPDDAALDDGSLVSIESGVIRGLALKTRNEAAVNICFIPSLERSVAWAEGRPLRLWLTDFPKGVTTTAREFEFSPTGESALTGPVLIRFEVRLTQRTPPKGPLGFTALYEIAEGASPPRILRRDFQVPLAP